MLSFILEVLNGPFIMMGDIFQKILENPGLIINPFTIMCSYIIYKLGELYIGAKDSIENKYK